MFDHTGLQMLTIEAEALVEDAMTRIKNYQALHRKLGETECAITDTLKDMQALNDEMDALPQKKQTLIDSYLSNPQVAKILELGEAQYTAGEETRAAKVYQNYLNVLEELDWQAEMDYAAMFERGHEMALTLEGHQHEAEYLQAEIDALALNDEDLALAAEMVKAEKDEQAAHMAVVEETIKAMSEKAGETYALVCSAIKQIQAGKEPRSPMWKHVAYMLEVLGEDIDHADRESIAAGWLLVDSGLPDLYYDDALRAVRDAKAAYRNQRRPAKKSEPAPVLAGSSSIVWKCDRNDTVDELIQSVAGDISSEVVVHAVKLHGGLPNILDLQVGAVRDRIKVQYKGQIDTGNLAAFMVGVS